MPVSRAANSDSFKTTTPSDREITITRLFDAPPELVFEAMTKPEHVRRWWGILDDTYSVTQCDIDLRPGGRWKFVGGTPQGEVCFYGEYREITAPSRMVYTEIFAPFPAEESVVTQTLAREGNKTRLTMTARYSSRDVRDMVLGTGMEHGAAISYDRLEEVASALQGSRA